MRSGCWEWVFQDWSVNPDWKIRLSLAGFRLAQRLSRASPVVRVLGVPHLVAYRVLVVWLLGIDLHWGVRAGPRLRIFHGTALVVHPNTVLGSDCVLRQSTTLGAKGSGPDPSAAPVLGDAVDVGPQVVVLGPVQVGSRSVLGAGAIVVKDVPEGAVVAGNPAREVRAPEAGPPATPGGGD